MNLLPYVPLLLFVWLPIMLYYWGLYKSLYWRRKNVASISGMPLIGNLGALLSFQKNFAQLQYSIYFDKPTRNRQFVGIHLLHQPAVFVKNPELLNRILVKDFSHFADR